MLIFHRAILALSLFFILAAPALAQTAPPDSASDLPAAASELLSANSGSPEAAPPATAAQPANDLFIPPEAPAPRYGIDLWWAGGMFLLVLTLLFITLKALGRFSRFRGGRGRASLFTLRGTLPLDNRKYLAAVEVEGRMLIVGVTPERVTQVAHWPLDSEADADEDFAFQFKNDTELPDITDPLAGGPK